MALRRHPQTLWTWFRHMRLILHYGNTDLLVMLSGVLEHLFNWLFLFFGRFYFFFKYDGTEHEGFFGNRPANDSAIFLLSSREAGTTSMSLIIKYLTQENALKI